MSGQYEELVGNAILGIDTLWGGDVMCASGTGRFIADSWFSDQPLPRAYTVAQAAPVRETGGVSAKAPDVAAIDAYLAQVDIPGAIAGMKTAATGFGGLRGEYLAGLALCFETMWDLAMEILGKGSPVPYDRCVMAVRRSRLDRARRPFQNRPDALCTGCIGRNVADRAEPCRSG